MSLPLNIVPLNVVVRRFNVCWKMLQRQTMFPQQKVNVGYKIASDEQPSQSRHENQFAHCISFSSRFERVVHWTEYDMSSGMQGGALQPGEGRPCGPISSCGPRSWKAAHHARLGHKCAMLCQNTVSFHRVSAWSCQEIPWSGPRLLGRPSWC